VRTSITVSAVGAAALGLALWLLAPSLANALGNPALKVGLEFFSIVVVTSIGSGLVAALFQGYSDVLPNALFVQLLNPALFFAILLVFLLVPPSRLTYTEALAAFVVANLVTLGCCVGYAIRQLPRHLPPGPHAPEARGRLLRFAAPLFAAAAMLSLAGSGDTLVLGIYRPPTDVGIYTASLTLARLLSIGISAASFIFLPVATRFLRRDNHRAIQLTYAAVTKWMLLLSLPLFLLFVVLPSSSLGFVYGPRLASIVMPLELAVAGAFGATVLGPAATTQIAYGRVRLLAINSAVAGVTDVGIAFLLVPTYGYVGAATAWGISTLLYAALCLIELALLDGIHPFGRPFVVPLLATSVPIALVLLPIRILGISVPFWILPPAAIAVAGAFVLVVLVTRSLDEGDRLLLGAVEYLIGRPVPFVRRLARWTWGG
jgi:O-antigen/teichoic acid export membrane protein